MLHLLLCRPLSLLVVVALASRGVHADYLVVHGFNDAACATAPVMAGPLDPAGCMESTVVNLSYAIKCAAACDWTALCAQLQRA